MARESFKISAKAQGLHPAIMNSGVLALLFVLFAPAAAQAPIMNFMAKKQKAKVLALLFMLVAPVPPQAMLISGGGSGSQTGGPGGHKDGVIKDICKAKDKVKGNDTHMAKTMAKAKGNGKGNGKGHHVSPGFNFSLVETAYFSVECGCGRWWPENKHCRAGDFVDECPRCK